jgi:uncharacterized protein YbaR (Trm112 family)
VLGETGPEGTEDPKMKGFKYMKNGHGVPGETKIVAGTAMISNGEKWLPYPSTAHELICEAQKLGWGFDDGIPVRLRPETLTPYVRILIGREAGENAETPDEMSPGIQFHITWNAPEKGADSRASWKLGEIYVRTSEKPEWETVTSMKTVRATMASHPVVKESRHVPVNA